MAEKIVLVSDVNVSNGAIPVLRDPDVLSACAPESLPRVPKKCSYPCSCQEKKTKSIDILALLVHPLPSQNREGSPYLLSFLLKLNIDSSPPPMSQATACHILVACNCPSIHWGKVYPNDPSYRFP